MMEYTISDPFDREDYHEDFTPLVLIEISDVIDPIDYHDAPETIYITLNRTQLEGKFCIQNEKFDSLV